jgi:predicted 2-oxoglutarate/Fe(II)-dependent dioxygenase YbiX
MIRMINGLFPGELIPDTTVAGCIDIFEGAWPDPEGTIAAVEEECVNPDSGFFWHRAKTIGQGADQLIRTNYDLPITHIAQETGNLLAKNIHNQTYIMLLASTIPYARKHDIEDMYHETYNILKYKTGQEYKAHCDSSRTTIGRSISAICYLNSDYEGGEIEFVNFGVKIKPEPGMLILFPSNYPYRHIAHPVKEGTKYAIVTWIHDSQP